MNARNRESLVFNYCILNQYSFAQKIYGDDIEAFIYAVAPYSFYIYNLNNETEDVASYMDIKKDRHGNLYGVSKVYYNKLKRYQFTDVEPTYLVNILN